MQRVSAVPVLAAVAAISLLTFLPGCGGNNNATNIVTPSGCNSLDRFCESRSRRNLIGNPGGLNGSCGGSGHHL